MAFEATLVVAPSKAEVHAVLNPTIASVCEAALKSHGTFTIALSGGSLPGFLSTIEAAFAAKSIDPKFDCWHVILADERCVTSDHADSNLGALQQKFLSKVGIPSSQVYGINEAKLSDTEAIAQDYESVVKEVLKKSNGKLDLAVLGFGPDGHTCSLFPGHALLSETGRDVAPIEDSPKPPPRRITLTYPVLNTKTRHVIFCGAGGSKSPILKAVFENVKPSEACVVEGGKQFTVTMADPAPYPCGGVRPSTDDAVNTLTWVADKDAVEGVIPE